MKLDAHRIHGGLFQGSRPPPGSALYNTGFRALVLCAEEHQPAASLFPGLEVIHAPNADDFSRLPSREELQRALLAARRLVPYLSRGEMVLSTCYAGRNRSGLVSALALHLWLGCSGAQAIQTIQATRPRSLGNPGFRLVLQRLTSRKTP